MIASTLLLTPSWWHEPFSALLPHFPSNSIILKLLCVWLLQIPRAASIDSVLSTWAYHWVLFSWRLKLSKEVQLFQNHFLSANIFLSFFFFKMQMHACYNKLMSLILSWQCKMRCKCFHFSCNGNACILWTNEWALIFFVFFVFFFFPG